MPKMKAHKGLKKRFKVTGKGKVVRQNSCGTHLMSTKNAKRKRRIGGTSVIDGKLGRTMKSELLA